MGHEIPEERVIFDAGRALHTRAYVDAERAETTDDVGHGVRRKAAGDEKPAREVARHRLDRQGPAGTAVTVRIGRIDEEPAVGIRRRRLLEVGEAREAERLHRRYREPPAKL